MQSVQIKKSLDDRERRWRGATSIQNWEGSLPRRT